MHSDPIDTDYIAGLFRVQEEGIKRMLDSHWEQIEERDLHTLRMVGAIILIVLTLSGVLLWHNDRILRLEHKMSQIQQKVGIQEGQAGIW